MVDKAKLKIELSGSIELKIGEKRIVIGSKKARSILSMLALANHKTQTRSWLKARLWSESNDERASASLRQALVAIRKSLGRNAKILIVNNESVSLDSSRIEIIYPEHGPILDGLDIRDEGFEDWLRATRANLEVHSKPGSTHRHPPVSGSGASFNTFQIGLLSTISGDNDIRLKIIGDGITDTIAKELRMNGIAEAHDLRDIVVEHKLNTAPLIVDFLIQTSIYNVDDDIVVQCRFYNAVDNRQLWSSTCDLKGYRIHYSESYELERFINEILEFILFTLNKLCFREQDDHYAGAKLALSSIHEMHKARAGDLKNADKNLIKAFTLDQKGIYLAWRAYLSTFLVGERIIDGDVQFISRVRELVKEAKALDPFNPLTLCLLGHVHSFLFKEYATARELFDQAFKQKPSQALCWDLSALTYIYTSNKQKALETSQIALQLGRYSPYNYCIETTCSMASAINKNFNHSITYGERAITDHPKFAAALRYLAAAYSHAGNHQKAKSVYQTFTVVEPDFTIDRLRDNYYPVAGEITTDFLEAGLDRLGTSPDIIQ